MSPERAEAAAQTPPVRLLVAFAVLGPVTIHMILPSLPHLQDEFGADFATTQLLVSLFVIAFGTAQVFVGSLADLLGRRSVLAWGMGLYAASSLLCALAPSIEALIGLRMVQALGACAGTVLARTIIRDHYDDREAPRMLGYLAIGISIGPIVAPMAGGLLFEGLGWQGMFWSLAALGAANTLLVLRFLPGDGGTGRFAGLGRLAAEVGQLLRHGRFLGYFLSVGFNAGAAFTFMVCAPLVGSDFLGLGPTAFGLWSSLGALGYILGNLVAGRLSARMRGEAVLLLGAVLVACASALMLLDLGTGPRAPALTFGLFAALMAASGLVMPNAFAGAMGAVPRVSGSASGLVGFAQFALGAAFATVASHLLESRGEPVWLGAVMLASSLCAVAVALPLARGARG